MKRYAIAIAVLLGGAVQSKSYPIPLPESRTEQRGDTTKVQLLLEQGATLKKGNPNQAIDYLHQAQLLADSIGFVEGSTEAKVSLGFIHLLQGRTDTASYYFEMAYQALEKQEPSASLLEALRGRGDVLRTRGELDEARAIYDQGHSLALSIQDTLEMANALNNIGNTHLDQNNLETALNYYQQCAALLPDSERTKIIATSNIGLVHYRMKDFENSIGYFEEGARLSKLAEDKQLQASNHQRIGIVERRLGNYEKSLENYNLALDLLRIVNDRRLVGQLSQNIGNIHFELEEYDQALEKYREALDIQLEIGDRTNLTYTLIAMGSVHQLNGNYAEAEKYYLQTKELSEEVGVALLTMDATLGLRELYAEQGKFEKAYEFSLLYEALNDSIFNANRTRQIAEMETKYETDKKEKEIELLNAEGEISELKLQTRSNQRNILILAAAALLVLALVLFSRYKVKERANQKLKQLDSMKSRFFTNISHEFRTPLTLILGPVENKLSKNPEPEEKEELLLVKRNADRLLELINQLLDLSKLEVGQLRLGVQEADFYKFLTTMASSFESLASQRNIKLTIEIPDESLLIFFDSDKCQKIIFNLLSNAFKYTQDGGKVALRTELSSENVKVSVQDWGPGIPLDQQQNIFKRFHQLNDSKHHQQGTGVGLALVRELVNLHYGKISLQSDEGEGSIFSFELPLSAARYQENQILTGNQDTIGSTEVSTHIPNKSTVAEVDLESAGDVSVLVVEDNDDIRKYISEILSESYKVLMAKDGREGLSRALDQVPELIISDLMMPEMDGMALCNELKSNQITSHIPVILLTAKADQASKIEGLETGADDYLIKPFNEEELKVRVRNLIEQREKLRKSFSKTLTLEPAKISITPPDESFINRAMNLVEENMSNFEFSVELFQREMAMSRMQLHRKLKALTSCSASEFIRVQRLKRAAQILETDGISVSEAAYKSGFNNLSYFAKCFKEQFGRLPSEYHGETAQKST